MDANQSALGVQGRKLAPAEVYSFYLSNSGVNAMVAGNLKLAEDYFVKALEFNSAAEHIWVNLGVVYKRLKKMNLAEAVFRKAIKLNRFDLNSIHHLAKLYRDIADNSESTQASGALRGFRSLQKILKSNPYYLFEEAKSHLDQKDYPGFRRLLYRAIAIHPNEVWFYLELLSYYREANNKVMLARTTKKALNNLTGNAVRSYFLETADLYLKEISG